jgi:hypothetical protein
MCRFFSYLLVNFPVSLIEEFRESEKQRLNWLQKRSANYPDVTETGLLARGYATPEIKSVRTIQPSIFRRSMYGLAFLVTLLSWLFLLFTWGGGRAPLGVYLVFVPFLLFASVSFLLVVFMKRYNYRLQFDASGLTIQGIFISWGEIVETAIMRQPQPRGVARFLVIFTQDGTVRKLDLFLFGISDRKLAAVVEYYKAQSLR